MLQSNRNAQIWNGITFKYPKEQRNKVIRFILNLYTSTRYLFQNNENVNMLKLFSELKNDFQEFESENIEEILEFIDKNKSQFQNLATQDVNALKRKIKLEELANKKYKGITEEQLVSFVKQSKRGLSLQPIYYYNRQIPKENVYKIEQAISEKIFDNVYILYYEGHTPNPFFKEATQEEKKDPIAFGVIANSDKLYFITDWEDEYCDLRFSHIEEYLKNNKL